MSDYKTTEKQKFSGQASFKDQLTNDFDRCFAVVLEHGFQTGWKKITGKPQHGNHNPNWKDCLDFVTAVIDNGKHYLHRCPDLPVLNKLPNRRSEFSNAEFWLHMKDLCVLYKETVKINRTAKRDGTIAKLYLNI